MQKFTIVGLILILGVGLFFAFNNYIYNEKQGDDMSYSLDTQGGDEEDLETASFFSTEVGVSFDYKTEPDGYVVEDVSAFIGEEDQGVKVVKVYRIINEREKIELENSEGGREGPPMMQLMVFNNELNQSASMWVDAYPVFSNIELALGDVDRDAVFGGANAVRYTTDGLYIADNVVVAHGAYIYHFIGQYLEKDSTIHQDFKRFVDSVTFIPTDTVPAGAPQAKIDVQVACESALAYTLFRTSQDAEAFVAQCINGDHPDVIQRYIESLGVDGAAI